MHSQNVETANSDFYDEGSVVEMNGPHMKSSTSGFHETGDQWSLTFVHVLFPEGHARIVNW